MLIFDENTMVKAEFTRSFVLCDSNHGIALADEDGNISESEYEFVETREGQECWLISGLFAENYGDNSMLFVYIPELDFATCVCADYTKIVK